VSRGKTSPVARNILADELHTQGGSAYIITFDRLTASKGFPWAIRVMGFIALTISLASFPALLSGSSGIKRPRKARKLVDKSAFRDPLFVVFTCSSFTCFLGYIVPYFYIPTYAQDHLGVSEEFALYILVIAIAASFFGRLSSGYVAHYAGVMLTWITCAFTSGILSLCWISIHTEKSFLAFSALWGK
jgi:predicted MFS family arabinose efflux permease